jgi:transcriptional regulator with XRE-family HTH domain
MTSKVQEIRDRRVRARIPGHVLCKKAGLHRSRLSDIERGAVTPSHEEVERIEQALSILIEVRTKMSVYASECGWPSPI